MQSVLSRRELASLLCAACALPVSLAGAERGADAAESESPDIALLIAFPP